MSQKTEVDSTAEFRDCEDVTAEQVANYLRLNPDFFVLQPEVLKTLTPLDRSSDDTVVDFQRFVVKDLREQLDGLRDCATEVIETSRSNLATQARTHAAVLALLNATSLQQIVDIIYAGFPAFLDVDVAVIGLEQMQSRDCSSLCITPLVEGEADYILGADRDTLLVPILSGSHSVFAHHAEPIRSGAFARLRPDPLAPAGLLALGSVQEGAFYPGQGSDLLKFLASITEVCLRRLDANGA
jgi:hypothetical protein